MMHTMEAARPAGEESIYLGRYFGCTHGDTTGQGLGVKGRAASLARAAITKNQSERLKLYFLRILKARELSEMKLLAGGFLPKSPSLASEVHNLLTSSHGLFYVQTSLLYLCSNLLFL